MRPDVDMWRAEGAPRKVAANSHATVWSAAVSKGGVPQDEPFVFFERKDAVVVVGRNACGEIALVQQHRFAADVFTWELPQGAIEAGESPLDAAARELREETGATLGSGGSAIGLVYEAADWCTAKSFVVVMDPVRVVDPEHAELPTWWIEEVDLYELVRRGGITDAATLAGLYLFGSKERGISRG